MLLILKFMINNYLKTLLIVLAVVSWNTSLTAQCTEWLNPSPTTGWTNFNDTYGGAPCDDGTGCPVYEFTDFEVFASEAYTVDNFVEGGSYSFSMCNGPGVGSWNARFTIIAPSGAIDAAGPGDGDGCTITWTCTESGTYTIMIWEQGNCGGGDNTATGNGYPALTCTTSPETTCAPPPEPCVDFTGGPWIDFGSAPCDDGSGCPFNELGFGAWASEAYTVDNFVAGGSYAFSICNGTGAWEAEFAIIAPSGAVDAFGLGDGDGCTISWTCSESGTYLIVINEVGQCGGGDNTATDNGMPALTCTSSPETMCEEFGCEAGTLTTTGEVTLCDDVETFDIQNDGAQEAPPTGGYGWIFDNTLGGSGALDGTFILTGIEDPSTSSYDSDLNGVLSGNGFPIFAGTWEITGAVYTDAGDPFNTVCMETSGSLIVNFGTAPTVEAVDNGDATATATATGGEEPYTYAWSNGQTTETAVDLGTATYTVTITDAFGCTGEASVDVEVIIDVEDIVSLEYINLTPNPTTGYFQIDLALKSAELVGVEILDVVGQEVQSFAPANITNKVYEVDLESQPEGVYLVRLNIGDQVLVQKIVVSH